MERQGPWARRGAQARKTPEIVEDVHRHRGHAARRAGRDRHRRADPGPRTRLHAHQRHRDADHAPPTHVAPCGCHPGAARGALLRRHGHGPGDHGPQHGRDAADLPPTSRTKYSNAGIAVVGYALRSLPPPPSTRSDRHAGNNRRSRVRRAPDGPAGRYLAPAFPQDYHSISISPDINLARYRSAREPP
jgi:hypothetical protein